MVFNFQEIFQIDSYILISLVHMRHETHACFVRQARDFTILTTERVEVFMFCTELLLLIFISFISSCYYICKQTFV